MPPEIGDTVTVWEVWFTHSQCSYAATCRANDESDVHIFDTWQWPEAAEEIERQLTARAVDCRMDAIVNRVAMPKAEYDALGQEDPPHAS